MSIYVPFWIIAAVLSIFAIIAAMILVWIIVQSFEFLADKVSRAIKINQAILRYHRAGYDEKQMLEQMNELDAERKEQKRLTRVYAQRLLVIALHDLSEDHFGSIWHDDIVAWAKERVDTIYSCATGVEWPCEIPQEEYNELRQLVMHAGDWPNAEGYWETK